MNKLEWNEHGRLILAALEELKEDVSALQESNQKIREDISALKVKAGLWGLLAGALGALSSGFIKGS